MNQKIIICKYIKFYIENMEGIPAVYWMIIFGALVAFVCFVLYEFAMLLRESKRAVSDSRKIIQEAEKTVDLANKALVDAQEIISTVKGTIFMVNDTIVGPIKRISSVVSAASGFVEGFASKRK